MLFDQMPIISKEEIQAALQFSSQQVIRNLPEFTDKFPNAYSEGGFYQPIENDYWTTGFWTGEIWLAYEYTRDIRLKHAGEIQMESFLNRIEKKINVDHHDMGFLYSPSCVAGYKLTGNPMGRTAALKAADQLMARFHPVGEFIQAWGGMESATDYRLIIDCLLNVPLLYWAAKETGDARYHDVAEKHVHTALKMWCGRTTPPGIHSILISIPVSRIMALPVRATGMAPRGPEVRLGAFMERRLLTAIPEKQSIWRLSEM